METRGYPLASEPPLVLQVPDVPEVAPGPPQVLDGPSASLWSEELQTHAASMPMPEGMTGTVWEALCKRMLTDIHRNNTMTADEKEAALRSLVLPIPGDPPGRTLRVVEDPNGVFTVGATGAVLWPAAVSLIQHLDNTVPAYVPNSRKRCNVVEFGAGLGSVGSFLKLHKGCQVTLTDVPEMLPLLIRNVTENFSPGDAPEVLPLRWGDADQLNVLLVCGSFDLVVGSDITYRPEYLDELLRCAHKLLRPGGRLLISAQDRPGEVQTFRAAVGRTELFRVVLDEEAPMLKSGTGEGTALEAGERRWGDEGVQVPDTVGQVLLLELEPKAMPSQDPQPMPMKDSSSDMLCTPDDVEAEFQRITGILPDPELCAAMRAVSEKRQALALEEREANRTRVGIGSSKSNARKERLINDFLERDMGDLLCDVDEELAAVINAKDPEDRPKTDGQKRRLAKAYYTERSQSAANPHVGAKTKATTPALQDAGASTAADDAAALEAITARGANADSGVASADACTTVAGDSSAGLAQRVVDGTTESKEVSPSRSDATAIAAKVSNNMDESGAKVRTCLPGLEWQVEINKAEKQLSVTVTFGDSIWEVLQGPSRIGESSFRDAVDFELSEEVLRVTHHGTVALELQMPQRVDAASASAKLSSRHKRVIVRTTFLH